MSQKERKVLDKQGQFLQVIKDGRKRENADWTESRIVLSNRRLVLAHSDGNRTIELSDVDDIGGRYDVNQAIARVSEYTAVRFGDQGEQVVLLTTPQNPAVLENKLYKALLDRETVLVRHPAVKGGVIQDTEWQKSRIKLDLTDQDAVALALSDGTFVEIQRDDISEFTTAEQLVHDENRQVLKVEHTDENNTSVQTHISGDQRHCSFMEELFQEGAERSKIGVELSYPEQKVLMALYSGVSPFEIPDFVDMDVEQVEDIYEELVELDVLDERQRRTEVELTAQGRKIASGAMEDE